MIVSGGENVYPKDIETILHQHPLIDDVVVLEIEDDTFGQRLCAFVVQKVRDEAFTPSVLHDWLNDKLARYQRPQKITFIDYVPRLSTGKVNRSLLLSK